MTVTPVVRSLRGEDRLARSEVDAPSPLGCKLPMFKELAFWQPAAYIMPNGKSGFKDATAANSRENRVSAYRAKDLGRGGRSHGPRSCESL